MSSSGMPTGTYFARTFNTAGYDEVVYDGFPCVGCSGFPCLENDGAQPSPSSGIGRICTALQTPFAEVIIVCVSIEERGLELRIPPELIEAFYEKWKPLSPKMDRAPQNCSMILSLTGPLRINSTPISQN